MNDNLVNKEIQEKIDAALVVSEKQPIDHLKIKIDNTKSFEEQAQDVATVIATTKALEDEGLVKQITDLKKDELTETAEANVKKSKAKSQDAEKELQTALFGVYEGLASYMGLKRDLPKLMLKVLMFFVQPILGLLLLICGLVVGTINILMDGVNSIAEKFATLSEITKRIVKSLLWLAVVGLVYLVLRYVLSRFGINIF